MSDLLTWGLLAFFLLLLFSVRLFGIALRHLWHTDWREVAPTFFFEPLYRALFGSYRDEELFVCIAFASALARLVIGSLSLIIVLDYAAASESQGLLVAFSISLLLIYLNFLIGDFAPRYFAREYGQKALSLFGWPTALFLTLLAPLFLPLMLLMRSFFPNSFIPFAEGELQQGGQILSLMNTSETPSRLDKQAVKLVSAVIRFSEHVAREVMVPRVDLFALSGETTIREAAESIIREGYSRIPVYRNSIDDIIGVLMYKDVLAKFLEFLESKNPEILDTPIQKIVKPALYTPETKTIASLLQDFRKKQVHMAIVVDEYGGTEGLLTIEDILEQIVGDIADEYDFDEELEYQQTANGWIVDAQMTILDIEAHLGIKIPQEGEYDTLGGYLFHISGTIPTPGFTIHHDDFELTVLESTERSIEKVRIVHHLPM